MKSHSTGRFRELLEQLPEKIGQPAGEAHRPFEQDRHHPPLRYRQIHQTQPIYSVRATCGYRAIGRLEDGAMIWFWIGAHDDYDKLLGQL